MKTDMKTIIIPDFMILLKILENEKDLILTDIVEKSGITYSHLHKLKKVFLKKGWITVTKDEEKRHLINLSFEGRNLLMAVNGLLEKLSLTTEDIKRYKLKTKVERKMKVDKMFDENDTEEIEVNPEKEIFEEEEDSEDDIGD